LQLSFNLARASPKLGQMGIRHSLQEQLCQAVRLFLIPHGESALTKAGRLRISQWDIPVGYPRRWSSKVARSTVFTTNRSQAVRLPKSMTLPPNVRHVEITKLGRSRLISPADQSWDAFFDGPPSAADFMIERHQPPARGREAL
jgi:antitoxin VapB